MYCYNTYVQSKEKKMMKNQTLDQEIQSISWPTDLLEAKEVARKIFANWQWKKKRPQFDGELERATNVKRVQELVYYTYLSGDGNGVI